MIQCRAELKEAEAGLHQCAPAHICWGIILSD
jgi:hypothetical protein